MTSAPNLSLRPWSKDDLPLLRQISGDSAMTEYLGGPETEEQLVKRLARYVDHDAAEPGRMYVITVGREEEDAGSVGYWATKHAGEPAYETGWSVLPAYQGRGIASLTTARILELAAAEGLYRFVHAFPSVENAPSNAVCRKLGFEPLGRTDFEFPPGHMMRCNDWRYDLSTLNPSLAEGQAVHQEAEPAA